MWFLKKHSSGQPISRTLLCEKVLFFNEKLNGDNGLKEVMNDKEFLNHIMIDMKCKYMMKSYLYQLKSHNIS